jgi:hypothetical protein
VHNHLIDDLDLAISLGVESNGFSDLGVKLRLEARPKGVKELNVSVKDDDPRYPKVDPNSFEEEL